MAVAYGQTTTLASLSGSHTSLTGTALTITESNPLLLCAFFFDGPEGVSSLAITFNSVSMTFLGSIRASSADFYIHIYALVAPTTGSSISPIATFGSTTRSTGIQSIVYSGANQASVPTVTQFTTGASSTSISGTITADSTANSWSTLYAMNDANNFGASTNSTLRSSVDSLGWFDSNGTIPTSAGYTQALTIVTSGRWVMGQVEVSPAVAAVNVEPFTQPIATPMKLYRPQGVRISR